jgi:hypothetical protein
VVADGCVQGLELVDDVVDECGPEGVGVGRGDVADGPGLADGVVVGRELADAGVAVADGAVGGTPTGGWMLIWRPKWLRVSRRR